PRCVRVTFVASFDLARHVTRTGVDGSWASWFTPFSFLCAPGVKCRKGPDPCRDAYSKPVSCLDLGSDWALGHRSAPGDGPPQESPSIRGSGVGRSLPIALAWRVWPLGGGNSEPRRRSGCFGVPVSDRGPARRRRLPALGWKAPSMR